MSLKMTKSTADGKEIVTIAVNISTEYPMTPEALKDAKVQILDDVADGFDKTAQNIEKFGTVFLNSKGKLVCTLQPDDPESEAEPEEKGKKVPNVA